MKWPYGVIRNKALRGQHITSKLNFGPRTFHHTITSDASILPLSQNICLCYFFHCLQICLERSPADSVAVSKRTEGQFEQESISGLWVLPG